MKLIWIIRRFIYWLLGIPDELEESIGGLNWAVMQNAKRISYIEGFLVIDEDNGGRDDKSDDTY